MPGRFRKRGVVPEHTAPPRKRSGISTTVPEPVEVFVAVGDREMGAAEDQIPETDPVHVGWRTLHHGIQPAKKKGNDTCTEKRKASETDPEGGCLKPPGSIKAADRHGEEDRRTGDIFFGMGAEGKKNDQEPVMILPHDTYTPVLRSLARQKLKRDAKWFHSISS
jgi:hypothetical protein